MSSYHERQKSLFNHLKVAEEQHGFSKSSNVETSQGCGTIDKYTYRKIKRDMKQFRGRESIYKRKESDIRDCFRPRTIPDHFKNPQKYVYYSLSDVTPDQLSDSTNTATALAFMREMEDREANIKTDHMDDTGVFKKPTFQVSKTVKNEPKDDQKAVFKSNKIIMPEYIVGVSKKKQKKSRNVIKSEDGSDTKKKADLKLNHLYDDVDEEDSL